MKPRLLYDERVLVPFWVWGVALVLAGSLGYAFGAYLGAAAGWTVGLISALSASVLLLRAAGRVVVTDTTLRADRATLPLESVGRVRPLDRVEAGMLRGRDADPRAFLSLKGWVPTAVRVDVVDRDDPTPYWYVSTRHPDRLADALVEARDARAERNDGSTA